jgi:hypothetical protein
MKKSNLLRTLTINDGAILVPFIEAYQTVGKFPLVWDIEIVNYKPSDSFFHPSGDCFTPPQQLWREKKGISPKAPISSALRRTFDCGHMWHGYLQAMLVEMGLVAPEGVEKVITYNHDRFTARGTVDLLDVEIPDQGRWLVDIKTMNKPEFMSGASSATFKKWEAQVNCYMDWTHSDKAMILAICKDSPHGMREYRIERNQNLLDEIYDRWGYVQEYLIQDKLPPEDDYVYDPMLSNPGDSALDVIVAEEKTVS